MASDFMGPANIGSEEMVSINGLVDLVTGIAGKKLSVKHISGPQGVRGRRSDNRLIRSKIGWAPSQPLRNGLQVAYHWIEDQIQRTSAR